MKKILTGSMLLATPGLAFAQANANSILGVISSILNRLIPILITAGLVYFIYGVVRYVIASDADAKKDAKDVVVRGIVGLFIILSIWGLIGVIQSTFGVLGGGNVNDLIPTVTL